MDTARACCVRGATFVGPYAVAAWFVAAWFVVSFVLHARRKDVPVLHVCRALRCGRVDFVPLSLRGLLFYRARTFRVSDSTFVGRCVVAAWFVVSFFLCPAPQACSSPVLPALRKDVPVLHVCRALRCGRVDCGLFVPLSLCGLLFYRARSTFLFARNRCFKT